MIIVVNVSKTYKAGMSCCEVRSIAHRAWAAGGLITDEILRDKTKYLIAVSNGVVVGIFCIKAVALDPSTKPNGRKRVAFWLICVTKECYDLLEKLYNCLIICQPGLKYVPGHYYIDEDKFKNAACKHCLSLLKKIEEICKCGVSEIHEINIKEIPDYINIGKKPIKRCDQIVF